jgi:hypothetical protein
VQLVATLGAWRRQMDTIKFATVDQSMEARKRAPDESQQQHAFNKQSRVAESALGRKCDKWIVFNEDDGVEPSGAGVVLVPSVEVPPDDAGGAALLPNLTVCKEFAAFMEVCVERGQVEEQEKAAEDARAAAFDKVVDREEWPLQFQRASPSEADAAAFCAPMVDDRRGRAVKVVKKTAASPLTAKEAIAAAEAKGLELVKSSRSATGFYGVAKTRRGTFEAQIREAGKNRSLGTYKTAEEAALIRAQHIGPEQVAALQERAVALEKQRAVALE